MTQIRVVLTIDEPVIDLGNYTSGGVKTTSITEAVQMDAELYEAGEISLDEFIHGYGGEVTVAHVEEVKDEEESLEIE